MTDDPLLDEPLVLTTDAGGTTHLVSNACRHGGHLVCTEAGARTSTVTRGRVLTQHTGLPPRETGAAPARPVPRRKAR